MITVDDVALHRHCFSILSYQPDHGLSVFKIKSFGRIKEKTKSSFFCTEPCVRCEFTRDIGQTILIFHYAQFAGVPHDSFPVGDTSRRIAAGGIYKRME